MVRSECKGGRLTWSFNGIHRLILPYEKHRASYGVLENTGEDADEGEEDAESDSIEEAYEEFDGDYSEEELRLIRLKFMSEVAN